MRSKLTSAVIALVVLGAGGAAFAASSGSSSQAAATQTLTVFSVTVQMQDINVGPEEFGLGDELVFSDDLFTQKGGEKIGIDGGVCTVVRQEDHGNTTTVQCAVTGSLHGGQIAVQGLVTLVGGQAPVTFVLPVTGGSGIYKNVRGQLTVEQLSETEANLTFELIGA